MLLTGFKNYLRSEKIQKKARNVIHRLKNQKYTQNYLVKECGNNVEYQTLAEILCKLAEAFSTIKTPIK